MSTHPARCVEDGVVRPAEDDQVQCRRCEHPVLHAQLPGGGRTAAYAAAGQHICMSSIGSHIVEATAFGLAISLPLTFEPEHRHIFWKICIWTTAVSSFRFTFLLLLSFLFCFYFSFYQFKLLEMYLLLLYIEWQQKYPSCVATECVPKTFKHCHAPGWSSLNAPWSLRSSRPVLPCSQRIKQVHTPIDHAHTYFGLFLISLNEFLRVIYCNRIQGRQAGGWFVGNTLRGYN